MTINGGQGRLDHAGSAGSGVGLGELDDVVVSNWIARKIGGPLRGRFRGLIGVPANGLECPVVDSLGVDEAMTTPGVAEVGPCRLFVHRVTSSPMSPVRDPSPRIM